MTTSPAPAEGHDTASPIELFFDLGFVFAFIELTHHLSAHLTWRGLAETLVLLLSVLIVWVSTSWSVTVVRADRARPTLALLATMTLGLCMNAAIGDAFGAGGWTFVIPLILIEVGRSVWALIFSPVPAYRDHYARTLLWVVASVPFWIMGALAEAEPRLVCWAGAAVLQIVGIWTAHPLPGRRRPSEAVPFDAPHFLERCALFLLIGLGETVISTGLALSATDLGPADLLAGAFALAGTIAMWGIIFGPSYVRSSTHLSRTSDPVRMGRMAVNAVIVMVTGLILTATANQILIGGDHGHSDLTPQVLLAVGPLLFVLGHLIYMAVVPGFQAMRHIWGLVALLVAGGLTFLIPPHAGLALIGGTLSTLALLDRRTAAPLRD